MREVCGVLQGEIPDAYLFVVNDGSQDSTLEILSTLAHSEPDLPFKILSYNKNRGYGAALLAGANAADNEGYEFALFMDSDLTNPPKLIKSIYELAFTGKYDLIKASRFISGGGMDGVPPSRKIISFVGNKVASILFGMGILDCTNGFRAVKLRLLRGVSFQERGFSSILEELYILKQKKARTIEIPYILTSRQKTQEASKFLYSPTVFYSYLKYAIKARFHIK